MSFEADHKLVTEFIEKTFKDTFKPAAGLLKFPYIIPGGPYATTLWDWDSYWTMLAIIKIFDLQGKKEEIEKIRGFACGTFFNFLDHQGADGAIPISIMPDDEDFFDSLKDPDHNMAKPFIAQTGKLLLEYGLLDAGEMSSRMDRLFAYHQCYQKRYFDAKTGLVFWAKDWGIGVDDDPVTWGRPEKSCASIFLNTFLYKDMLAAGELAEFCGRKDLVEAYAAMTSKLAAAIEKYCWDEREKSYFSVDIQCHQNLTPYRVVGMMNKNLEAFWNCLKLKVLSWNCILPFWAGLGSQERFDAFVRENLTPERLRSPYGIRSLSLDEPMYQPEIPRGNPSNWLGPIWFCANYVVWETLKDRGHKAEADALAKDLTALLANDLRETGAFHEYYSPETGKGVNGPGFMSWNALAGALFL